MSKAGLAAGGSGAGKSRVLRFLLCKHLWDRRRLCVFFGFPSQTAHAILGQFVPWKNESPFPTSLHSQRLWKEPGEDLSFLNQVVLYIHNITLFEQ